MTERIRFTSTHMQKHKDKIQFVKILKINTILHPLMFDLIDNIYYLIKYDTSYTFDNYVK